MTTEEPYHANHQPPPLDGPAETEHPRSSPASRSQYQRGLPSPSDCRRPVLCLGEASQASRAHRPAKQSKRAQETRSCRADAHRNSVVAGGGSRTDVRESAAEKGVLAVGSQ